MALSGRCYVIGQLYRGHYGAVTAENVSKVTRLLSAGARHEAQAGHHTRPQTTCPGDPDSRRLLGPWAGKRTQDRDAPVLTRVTPAGPRRRPARAALMTALRSPEGALFTPGAAGGQADAQDKPGPSTLTGLPESSNVWSKPPSACSSSPRPSGHLHPSPRSPGLGREARGRERKLGASAREGGRTPPPGRARQRARPDGRDGHFRKPQHGPGEDLVAGRRTFQVSVKA